MHKECVAAWLPVSAQPVGAWAGFLAPAPANFKSQPMPCSTGAGHPIPGSSAAAASCWCFLLCFLAGWCVGSSSPPPPSCCCSVVTVQVQNLMVLSAAHHTVRHGREHTNTHYGALQTLGVGVLALLTRVLWCSGATALAGNLIQHTP